MICLVSLLLVCSSSMRRMTHLVSWRVCSGQFQSWKQPSVSGASPGGCKSKSHEATDCNENKTDKGKFYLWDGGGKPATKIKIGVLHRDECMLHENKWCKPKHVIMRHKFESSPCPQFNFRITNQVNCKLWCYLERLNVQYWKTSLCWPLHFFSPKLSQNLQMQFQWTSERMERTTSGPKHKPNRNVYLNVAAHELAGGQARHRGSAQTYQAH